MSVRQLSIVLLVAGAIPGSPLHGDTREPPPVLPAEERLPLADENLPAGQVSEEWLYAGRTSALIYWQTENRASSYVEYGPTDAYGERTATSPDSWVAGKPYYSHFHRLASLQPATVYHYRMVSIGTDGKEDRSDGKTLVTGTVDGVIQLPGALVGPPYFLDTPGATYVLTQDITTPLGAIAIGAGGITLDLDGHTITYNDQPGNFPDERWATRINGPKACWGVMISGSAKEPVRVLNGIVLQGMGNDTGSAVGIGCNPLYADVLPEGSVIAGVEFVWSGADISGLYLHWGTGGHVHHCVIEDRGTVVSNRHQAISSIEGDGGGHNYDHNLVKATRHQGLCAAIKAHHNEIYINSYDTNSIGVLTTNKAGPVDVAYNKVFGSGNHPIAFAMYGAYQVGSKLHHNYAEVMCTRRGEEYGWSGSACFRTTWGADGLDVFNNTFIGYSLTRDRGGIGSTGQTRVLWVGLPYFKPSDATEEIRDARAVFHDNLLIARGLDPTAKAAAIGVVCNNQSQNLIFMNNTVVSTWSNVLLADSYGHADGFPKFVGNTFRREGDCPSYATIRSGFSGSPATAIFLDNRYEGDASPRSMDPKPGMNIILQKLVVIDVQGSIGTPEPNVEVTVTDRLGVEVFRGRTSTARTNLTLTSGVGDSLVLVTDFPPEHKGYLSEVTTLPGQAAVLLVEGTQVAMQHEVYAPHTITVHLAKGSVTKEIPVGLKGRLEIRP